MVGGRFDISARRRALGGLIASALLAAVACGGGLPDPRPLPPGVSLSGRWYTNWGELVLQQRGDHVFGQYKGFRNGSVSGELDGDLFLFRWTQVESRLHGHGYMQLNRDGSRLEGRWGYGDDQVKGGRWWARRLQ